MSRNHNRNILLRYGVFLQESPGVLSGIEHRKESQAPRRMAVPSAIGTGERGARHVLVKRSAGKFDVTCESGS